jgi:hypothetical protein
VFGSVRENIAITMLPAAAIMSGMPEVSIDSPVANGHANPTKIPAVIQPAVLKTRTSGYSASALTRCFKAILLVSAAAGLKHW